MDQSQAAVPRLLPLHGPLCESSLPRRSTFPSKFTRIACLGWPVLCLVTRVPTHAILLDMCASLFQTVRMTRCVSCHHVKGHSGHPWNELADRLAATAARLRWRCSFEDWASHDGPSCYMLLGLLQLPIPLSMMTSWCARLLSRSLALTESCRREPSSPLLHHALLAGLAL